MATDCLFCKIIGGQLPATVVYRDDRLIAIRDLNPVAPTHILFITIRHIASIAEAEAEPERPGPQRPRREPARAV